ncbi:MBL fold metallo-hydrolase [Candidatus Gracilibacteria bacterium]|nr:MBL fold metallo-hydrolase [Candidatus Gracilibacteria bacterium]
MIITPLGHTEFLVDIANSTGDTVRILVDTWLSDYAIGDLMERSIRLQLDPSTLSSIDAIYISHAHTDHLDPYTLMEIYQYSNPLLILPVTLRFLAPLFVQYLPTAQIHWLAPREIYILNGVEIMGYIFAQSDITNEDAVMMISIANDEELIFAEIDTVPDEYDTDIATALFQIFDRKEYKTRCYLASRNELEGQLRMYDYTGNRQKSFRSEYIAGRKEEIRASYEKYEYEEYSDMDNIMTLPGFVRGYIGQGLQYPTLLSASLSELSMFPLDEIASMESDIARGFGYDFTQRALTAGRQYKIENGTIEQGRKECPIGEIQKSESKSQTEGEKRAYAQGPLIPREYTPDELIISIAKIRNIINHRFLPYWSASPVASLRSALIQNRDGAYRIGFKINTENSIIFEYGFASSEFIEIPYTANTRIDEDYWLPDILDYIDGRQELYSNFWHTLDPKRIYRLWTCLGADYMNNSIVIAKYRLHFERAKRGETANEWVSDIIQKI